MCFEARIHRICWQIKYKVCKGGLQDESQFWSGLPGRMEMPFTEMREAVGKGGLVGKIKSFVLDLLSWRSY